VAWWYAKKEKKKYDIMNKQFKKKYKESLEILKNLEQKGCIKKENLWIMTSEDHI